MSGALLLSSLAALVIARPQSPVAPVSSMPAPTGTEVAASSTITVSGVPTDGPGNGTDFPGLAPLVPQSASSPELPFRILADTKDSRVAGLQFMAAEGYFWLGRMDAANNTAIQVNNSQAFMYTAAPGGQRVFVEGDGALSFTAAHTGGAIPNGGIGESFGVKGQLLRREFSFSERHDAPNISDPNAVFDDSPIFISPWLACPIGQQANSPGPGQIEPTTTTGSNDGPAKRATDEDCQPYEQCADGHFNQPDSVTQPPPGFVPPTGNGTADIGPYKIYATKISIEGVEDPPNPGCMKIGTNVRFIGSVNKPAPEPIEYFY